ncbi:unnamed protein product [Meganyctiphanes norvegica]|uniref:Chaoptin n=1 Tax=Meganyctiphanes norvegica TaxID=48144 RepID=A0AAV2RN91_MEGNR
MMVIRLATGKWFPVQLSWGWTRAIGFNWFNSGYKVGHGKMVPCPTTLMLSRGYKFRGYKLIFPFPVDLDALTAWCNSGYKVGHGQLVPSPTAMGSVITAITVADSQQFKFTPCIIPLLFSNNLVPIVDKMFNGMSRTLRSLDLRFNELVTVPKAALAPLRSLDWIDLHGNNIAILLPEDWVSLRSTLTTLFLGENDIDHVPREVFSRCKNLLRLDLDKNNIFSLDRESLPRSLLNLNLNHNLLTGFPSEAVQGIVSLTWLYLRGNLLDRLPDSGFTVHKSLDRLDLGENFIRFIPGDMFNGTLTARDLHLDFNLLTEIQDHTFKRVNPARLYLSSNNIHNISDKAFEGGPEHTLVMLDLEKNKLDAVPKALSVLKGLRYLYMPDNLLPNVSEDAFRSFCMTLEALSLSGNQLTDIPRSALENCSNIAHLNLGHNYITEIFEEDFETWGLNLDTLLLMNNRIRTIPPHAFRHTPKLRELSLSFNRIIDVDTDSFIDILNTLEILEISFGFYRDDFPEDVLKPLTSLQWLALDNNNFRTITETALYSFGELRYFNMDSNRLTHIPKTLFHQNVHKNLGDIRLSYNFLERLDVHTFHNLEGLRNIVIDGNKIKVLHFECFKMLPKLATVILSNNEITKIEARAFSDLPELSELVLYKNRLTSFSTGVFANVTNTNVPLSLNISHNSIKVLNIGLTAAPFLKSLDAKNNVLTEVPINFLAEFTKSMQRLDLSNNLIKQLDSTAFGPLENLQMLIISHNEIEVIRPNAFQYLSRVQFLDLSHNHLKNLPHECFTDITQLRVLHLNKNHLRSFPASVFRDTKLETLSLANNEFVSMPTAGFSEVEQTLHYLDMSNNHLEHLDSTMFYSFPNLVELNLASNRLTILPDNVFQSLEQLISLDLSSNPMRANFKELFHYTQNIQKLNLANVDFKSSPVLPLPNLVSLNLSSNAISELEVKAFKMLKQLRFLDLSYNMISELRSRVWVNMPYLKHLDLSFNPLMSLTKESFAGAERIEVLVLKNLDEIDRFDYDALSSMTYIRELYMNTFPNIEKYRFRVGHLLATVHTLQKLHLEIREEALTDQLSGAFGPKLKELHISGTNLKTIESKTFRGFQNKHELLLAISGTSIQSLPDGLLAHLSDVHFLSLDLRKNDLKFLNPHVLYENGSDWESIGTTFIAASLPLLGQRRQSICTCRWLTGQHLSQRRLIRNLLQFHFPLYQITAQLPDLIQTAQLYRITAQLHILRRHSNIMTCDPATISDVSPQPSVMCPRNHQ